MRYMQTSPVNKETISGGKSDNLRAILRNYPLRTPDHHINGIELAVVLEELSVLAVAVGSCGGGVQSLESIKCTESCCSPMMTET